MADNSKAFTPEEEEQLELTQRFRLKMLNDYTKDGEEMPEKVGDLRVVKELLSDIDEQVTKKSMARARVKEVDANVDAVAIAANVLNNPNRFKPAEDIDATDAELIDINIPDDIVPGEDAEKPEPLKLEDFQTVFNDED